MLPLHAPQKDAMFGVKCIQNVQNMYTKKNIYKSCMLECNNTDTSNLKDQSKYRDIL